MSHDDSRRRTSSTALANTAGPMNRRWTSSSYTTAPSAEIVVGFTDRLTHLGAASALLAGTALSVVRQRQAAGDPVERGDPVIRDWATVLGLLTDAGAVVHDDDVQRLFIGPRGVRQRRGRRPAGGCRRATLRVPHKVREMPARALLTSVVRVQQAVVACRQDLSPPRLAPS